jgi:hypothetical protein
LDPGGRSFKQFFVVGGVEEKMTLLRPNNVSLGEALCTEEVVFSDNALSCGYFIVTLDTYALDMVVVLAESFRFP